jgi:SAM-dependent methyltransferase
MTDRRSQLVAAGYDRMAGAWEDFAAAVASDPRAEWRDELLSRLEPGSRVVELGCGNGTAETELLARHHRLVGVDLSAEQLRKARLAVPDASLVQADLLDVEFDPGSIDAVASFYVFNHVPRERLAELLDRVHTWLRPGGPAQPQTAICVAVAPGYFDGAMPSGGVGRHQSPKPLVGQ